MAITHFYGKIEPKANTCFMLNGNNMEEFKKSLREFIQNPHLCRVSGLKGERSSLWLHLDFGDEEIWLCINDDGTIEFGEPAA
jgi:hypothetical protein